MPTIAVDPANVTRGVLAQAIQWLRDGGVLAMPTDTFYGLAANPASPAAVRAIFDVKGRRADAALPFVAADRAQVEAWCGRLPAAAAKLAEACWPGPLSLVLDPAATIAPEALGGEHSIAIRVPDAVVTRAIAHAWGTPLPATSANLSGAPPAAAVAGLGALADDPRVLVLDAGPTPGGAPSTIVDVRGDRPRLIRDGAVPWERVLRLIDA